MDQEQGFLRRRVNIKEWKSIEGKGRGSVAQQVYVLVDEL